MLPGAHLLEWRGGIPRQPRRTVTAFFVTGPCLGYDYVSILACRH